MNLKTILMAVLLAICSISCSSSSQKDDSHVTVVETKEVTDSAGYELDKGNVYAKIAIEEPCKVNDLCKNNFATWLSTVLEREKTSDKDAVRSLASAYIQTRAANLKNEFLEELKFVDNKQLESFFTEVEIRKIYEDNTFITYLMEEDTYSGGEHGMHLSVGYTFNKSDFSLSDLINPEDSDNYRKEITESLGNTLVSNPSKLMNILQIDDKSKKEGLVPLPANGAYLENDSLVFKYQEFEITPYKYGIPCVKIKYEKKE